MGTIQASSIDEVIKILDDIILSSEKNKDPSGYFAALYRKVTIKVKEGIKKGVFDDGVRMEHLDVIFANRYIKAYYNNQNEQEMTRSWKRAFEVTPKFWPIVLQHLLLGMNAHISLDLGIAAAEVSKAKNIKDLKGDFNKINDILSSMVTNVERDLSRIWPTLRYILDRTKKVDTFFIDFSMEIARDKAWEFATSLADKSSDDIDELIKKRDEKVANNSKIITHPGLIARIILAIIRLGEKGNVHLRIKELKN